MRGEASAVLLSVRRSSASQLAPAVSTWRIFAGVAPFVLTNILTLVLVVLFPAIALLLPGFMK